MTPRVRSAALLAVALGLSAAAGCGPVEPKPVPVSGTVTLDGQPLADGFLYFKTMETGGLERFDVSGGTFQGTALPGNRRVEVIVNQPKMVVIDGARVEVPDNIIDPKFNLESGLIADVTPDGPNKFTFEVKRKK